MARYLAAEEVKASVQRLQDSRADSSLVDFLILKRAMSINESSRVELSTQDHSFMQAVSEFVQGTDAAGTPLWFNPYGTAREVPLGYRTGKYPSNGTAVTVGHWTELVDVVDRNKARIVAFKEGYEARLAGRLLVRGDRPLPRLGDAAVWFYRIADLDDIAKGTVEVSDLIASFVASVGLEKTETGVLFDDGASAQKDPEATDGT
jgi:hypothetical protein